MSELKQLESEKGDIIDSSIVPIGSGSDVEYSGGENKDTLRHLKPRHVQLIAISYVSFVI